jgi:hypothetical protein
VGLSLRDRQQNKKIGRRTESILQYIQSQQIKWFGHVQRMHVNTLNHRASIRLTSGYKLRGRPRKILCDNICDTLQGHGITMCEATRQAKDRVLKIPRY